MPHCSGYCLHRRSFRWIFKTITVSQMRMEEAELKKIIGGATISGTLINSFCKGIEIILEVGRSFGSAIRRLGDHNTCPY